jgi:hypothetical protein
VIDHLAIQVPILLHLREPSETPSSWIKNYGPPRASKASQSPALAPQQSPELTLQPDRINKLQADLIRRFSKLIDLADITRVDPKTRISFEAVDRAATAVVQYQIQAETAGMVRLPFAVASRLPSSPGVMWGGTTSVWTADSTGFSSGRSAPLRRSRRSFARCRRCGCLAS